MSGFLVVSARVRLVYYFQMMAYLILGQVPVCLCMSWGTALVTVVLMPWMKLMRSGCSEIISKSVVTILSHGSASKGIHPAALYMLWNQEKMLVTVTEIHCSEKKEHKLNHWKEFPH